MKHEAEKSCWRVHTWLGVLDCVGDGESRKVYREKTVMFRFIVLKGHPGANSRGSYSHSFKKWTKAVALEMDKKKKKASSEVFKG